MPTVLITGCSTGFGLEIARSFLERDWNVIATMRNPQDNQLPPSERLRVLPLDVTDQASIDAAVAEAGKIDVLVNNAGFGWLNAAEGTSMDMTRRLFETNTFGPIAMTRAVLPQFRERRSGVIVNVTSSTTLKPLPLLSAYTASKAAVNAFTASLAEEIAQFGIRAERARADRAGRRISRALCGTRRADVPATCRLVPRGSDVSPRRGGSRVARGHRPRLPQPPSGGSGRRRVGRRSLNARQDAVGLAGNFSRKDRWA